MTTLYRYENYNAPVKYLFDKCIKEYDISKANISVLREMNKITDKEYLDLLKVDRMSRQYYIGYKIKNDPSIQTSLTAGLEEARGILCKTLSLEDTNILHIVKDAVFVITPMTKRLPNTVNVSKYITFTCRGTYTNYMNLFRGLNIYHDANSPILRIRGMSDESLALHKNYFHAWLKSILDARQIVGFMAAYTKTKDFYSSLINRKCPIEVARRFDSLSMYDIKQTSSFSRFTAEYLSEGAEMMVDPSFNLGILETVGNYLVCDKMSNG